ncbi:hypothetical protein [Stenotrophomonas sp.]|uniref:hypothetical protein n=1 Tax=Stenotrophomonas sp. TaxID=69392 RepID=UPI002899942A|nr:hypothetical protein [Stenotrophomonas sp.]
MKKPCTTCFALLLPHQFAPAGNGTRKAICTPCSSDDRRLRRPLPEIPRDPVQVQLNNTFNLWHGPVSRLPLRSHS